MAFLKDLFTSRPKVIPESISTLEQFKASVINSELPVIIDVWSESCAPCRQLVPILTNIATKHAGRIKVVAINTASELTLVKKLAITATPTLIIFNKGQEMGREVGARPEAWFDSMIEAEFS